MYKYKMNHTIKDLEYYFYNISANSNTNKSLNLSDGITCDVSYYLYNSSFGILTAVPDWEALSTILVLVSLILGTIFGNILVILGVFTHKPLRIVQNFFIVSLAAADIAVAVLVMPLNVAYGTLGRWLWGKHLCKMWLTCDIMCCTSSILNLCAIALDRYWAITDPINYSNKRTLKRVMTQILIIWILSLIISSPPLLGWNDWPDEFTTETPCQLTSELGYVIYSSLGSFFIPLGIMTIVYLKIFFAAKKRLRRRTIMGQKQRSRSERMIEFPAGSQENKEETENESESEESLKRCQRKSFLDVKRNLFMPFLLLNDPIARQKIESEIEIHADSTIKKTSLRKSRQQKLLLVSAKNNGDVVYQFIEQKQKISLSKERRAARTLGIVMGVFVICWLPFFLMYVVLSFCPWCCPNIRIINFITWLGYVNSTANPIIYTIFNLDFRRAFKKLLRINK